jgi:hypothetical protein
MGGAFFGFRRSTGKLPAVVDLKSTDFRTIEVYPKDLRVLPGHPQLDHQKSASPTRRKGAIITGE